MIHAAVSPGLQPLRLALLVSIALCLFACSARPGWTTRLPDKGDFPAASPAAAIATTAATTPLSAQLLVGEYERTVDSRYGVGNPRAHSLGQERIVIRAASGSADASTTKLSYTRLHLYAEQVDVDRVQRAYRETGRVVFQSGVQGDQSLVLLVPEEARAFERKTELSEAQLAANPAKDVPLPDPAGIAWESVSVPGALLHYYEAARDEPHPHYSSPVSVAARLTPFAYEAFGEIYDFGIFEGTESPYDLDSRNFKDALQIWNGKRNQPHAYIQIVPDDAANANEN